MSRPLPRGIAPDLLLSQVKNTMPYLFDEAVGGDAYADFPPAAVLRDFAREPERLLSHFEYFRLCLSAHYLTCGTPVPTDVDNQIRSKLWPAALPLGTALEMVDLVLKSRHWDYSPVTGRMTHGLSGHLGEWFTVAVGAYCALGQWRDSPEVRTCREAIFQAIAEETEHHSEVFGRLWRAGEGLDCLKASGAIAHNFGDLDRVMDMWDLSPVDPLRIEFYKLGIHPLGSNGKLRHQGRLWVAGELYKSPIQTSSMAMENHRHFALRKPRCLRQAPELMVVTGPFMDEWGRRVARKLAAVDGTPSEQTMEVIEALQQGWARLPGTLGYGRALRGMSDFHSELKLGKSVEYSQAQDRFEKAWREKALQWMDEIPAKAPC